jgi:hypothetical protein
VLIKFPKNDKNFSWTQHIKNKMLFYGLSEQRIKNVFRDPRRKQEGVAQDTFAAMKRNDRGKRKEEIWVMYKVAKKLSRNDADTKSRTNAENKSKIPRNSALLGPRISAGRILMISAWRYPGISKPGAEIPIPEDILNEINEILD